MITTLVELFKNNWRWWLAAGGLICVAVLCLLLVNSRADLSAAQRDNDVLRNDNALQGRVIATQVFNINRFNKVAQLAAQANAAADASAEKTVIEYREILRREKTCDLPVPAAIADGLLEYTNNLRTSAMYPDTGVTDATGNGSVAASGLTYCQAVLWINPLLVAIEKANNQLVGIRQVERHRWGIDTPHFQ